MESHSNLVKILKEIVSEGSINISKMKSLSFEEQELIRDLEKNDLLNESLFFVESMDEDQNWDEFRERIFVKKRRALLNWGGLYKYAAIFVAFFALACFLKFNLTNENKVTIPNDSIQLVLENGDIQVINPNGEKQIIKKEDGVVVSQKENHISYSSQQQLTKLVYNEIKIPYGKTFLVTLSDGTKVTINSGSSLKYPIQFIKGYNREVVLNGEAFFEVSKDKTHPFIVKTRGVNIRVLGTKFNVSSYSEDVDVNTVLVEGSVSLSNTVMPNEKVMLVPGEKGTWKSSQKEIIVEKVDTKFYTEWMGGELIFRKTTFKDIIIKLERIYNVTIENNRKDLLEKKFNGSFNRNVENIDDVLSAMSKIQNFTFKRNEKNIIID